MRDKTGSLCLRESRHWSADTGLDQWRQLRLDKRMVSDVVIVAAKRTPIGSFNGSLSTVAAHDLASGLIKVNIEN